MIEVKVMDISMGTYIQALDLEDESMRVEAIDPQLLNNDRAHYQRNRIEERVEEKLKHYHAWKEKHCVVAQREDGTYWIINGQHHADAAMRLGATSVPCFVFNSTGWKFEAQVFKKFQDWQRVNDPSKNINS